MQGGRWLQESQKIAQEGIALPGTSDRWDFLLPMEACGNADFTLLAPFFFLEPLWNHSNLESQSEKGCSLEF